MLLHDESDIKYDVKVSKELNLNDKILTKLLNNLDYKYEIDDDVFKGKKGKTVYISTYDTRKNTKISEVWF